MHARFVALTQPHARSFGVYILCLDGLLNIFPLNLYLLCMSTFNSVYTLTRNPLVKYISNWMCACDDTATTCDDDNDDACICRTLVYKTMASLTVRCDMFTCCKHNNPAPTTLTARTRAQRTCYSDGSATTYETSSRTYIYICLLFDPNDFDDHDVAPRRRIVSPPLGNQTHTHTGRVLVQGR